MHLPLGNDAVQMIRDKLVSLESEIAAWEAISRGTDFS
jgi:hypothetical protein